MKGTIMDEWWGEQKMRPEFELLGSFFRQLYCNVGISREFLRIVENHIDLCEHIVETKTEKELMFEARFWWTERAGPFNMVPPRHKPPITVTALTVVSPVSHPVLIPTPTLTALKLTNGDKKFLRSLRISPPED